MLRRIIVLLAAMLLAVAMTVGSALAMQPPGGPAQHHFGCVDGEDDAVGGHPGARGLEHATPKVAGLTGDGSPTAWNAVEHADPIELGGCP